MMEVVQKEPGATEAVARFIVATGYDDLPDKAVEMCTRVITDSLSCILSGPRSEVGPSMLAYLDRNPGGRIPVVGTSRLATPSLAALLNGTFGAALDFDDLMTPMHPSAVVVAALVSSVDARPVSGRAFIEAYAIGIEVGHKVAIALGRGHSERGFHATGTMAGFSAFAALAKLNNFTVDQIRTGIGLVASNSGGMLCALGTMCKPYHSGLAAQAAVDAVALINCGFTASPNAIEHKRGFFACYGTPASDPSRIGASLGKPWAVVEPGSTMKKFPACVATHRAMKAMRNLKEQGATARNVVSIGCSVAPGALSPLMYSRPKTGLEGKFSLEYAIAAALYDDRISIDSFETPAVSRPDVMAIVERVRGWEDEKQALEDPVSANLSWGFRGYARVTARLDDGRTLTSRVDVPPGHPSMTLTWDELQDKMMDCGMNAGLGTDAIMHAFCALKALDRCESVADILRDLRLREN